MKMKRWIAFVMIFVMMLTLIPGNIVNATELDTVNEISTEAATETTETVTTEAVTTEAVTSEEYTSEEVTTEITTETLDEITTETPTEQTTEEVTEDTEEDTEEETTEEAETGRVITVSPSGPCGYVNGIIAYPYGSSLSGEYTMDIMTDNPLLAKALYYSYGSLGYAKKYETIDKAYQSYGATNDTDKISLSKEILTNIKRGTYDDKTSDYVSVISTLPAYNPAGWVPYYIYNANQDVVGFTSTSSQGYSTPHNTITDILSIEEAEEELLGATCSNGYVTSSSNGTHGWADESGYTYISNPGAYGFPTKASEITAWAASYKYYDFSYAGSYSHSTSGYSSRIINVNINGNTLGVTMSKCLTGSVDSTPSSSDDTSDMTFSQASNLRYPDSTSSYHLPPDGRTKNPQVEARIRVDSTNHRVYIRFITPYIHYDGSTAVQATNGGVWYTYTVTPPAYEFKFNKQSANPNCTNGNPLYSLAGAEYTLKKTDGTFAKIILGKDGDNYIYGDTSTTPLVTDADGNLTYTFTYAGAGSNITGMYASVQQSGNTYTITFSNGMKMLEGNYKLQETKASPGFGLDVCVDFSKAHSFSLSASNPTATITCNEPPIMDPLRVQMLKKDAETGEINPIGGASLSGAIFEVAYYNGLYSKAQLLGMTATRKWYFATDENDQWKFETSQPVNNGEYSSDPFYMDVINNGRAIPFGTVTVKEVKAPKGYLTTDNPDWKGSITVGGNQYPDTDYVMYQIKIARDGQGVDLLLDGTTELSGGTQIITNEAYDQPIRGNLKLTKLKADNSATIVDNSGEPMANIAFIMESMTTGEKHIVVTDENGQVDTSGSSRKNVNGNDRYLDALTSDKVYNNELRPTSIWFFGTADENAWDYTTISKNRGCLPYDTYTITELASKGNEGTQLINRGSITFDITDDTIKEVTVTDVPNPKITTNSRDRDTGTTDTYAEKNCSVVDTVTYQYLTANTSYTLKGILVAREKCMLSDGTVYEPGEPILDDYGKYITINKPFKAAASTSGHIYDASGEVKLNYSFDAETLSGVKAVWQTYLCQGTDNTPLVVKDKRVDDTQSNAITYVMDGTTYYVSDNDLNNDKEWVTFKNGYEIHTTALSEDTKDHMAGAYPEAKIIDTVALKGLKNNRTYKLVGTLMDKATGEPLDIGGKTLTVQSDAFSATASEMTKDVIFEFDATYIAGKSAVVYETLYVKALDDHGKETEEWIEVTKHQDIDDEGQTVHYSDIHTTAMGKDTESHEVKAAKSVTIIDEVAYSNLIVGKEYTVKGILMLVPDGDEHITDKDKVTEVGDKIYQVSDYSYTYDESAGIYVDQNGYECHPLVIDGNTVTSEVTFTATQPDGVVPMEFTFDARKLAKKSVVVFEDVYYNGIKVGTHADITDDNQTITFKPKDTSISVRTKTTIGGHGNVRTGDIVLGVILVMLISMLSACAFYFAKHKEDWELLKQKIVSFKKKNKTFMLLLFCGLLITSGCIVVHANGNVTVNQDVEVDGEIYQYQLVTEYESEDPDTKYDFKNTYEKANLKDVSYEVIQTTYPTITDSYSKTYKDVEEEDSIDETITRNGIKYKLVDVSYEEKPVFEDVEYTVEYGYRTSAPSPADTYRYDYTSPVTGEEMSVELPFVRLNKGTEGWVDGFSAIVTFKNLEGEEFTLGDHKFTYSDNLALTDGDYKELVRMLGYDTSLYRLHSISWNGGAYQGAEDQLWRDATAYGQQYAAKYSAYYADRIETGTTTVAKATYEATIEQKDEKPVYTIRATGLYKNTDVWTNIISFVTEHKAVSGIFLFLILALIAGTVIALRIRNNKKAPSDEEELNK